MDATAASITADIKQEEQLADDASLTKDKKEEEQLPDDSYSDDFEIAAPSAINDLDTINYKRQEEKEVFQKLIDDCTKLQVEVDSVRVEKDDLEGKLDICRIQLETEKDKTQEQVR